MIYIYYIFITILDLLSELYTNLSVGKSLADTQLDDIRRGRRDLEVKPNNLEDKLWKCRW